MSSRSEKCNLCGLAFKAFEEKVGLNTQNGKITTCLYHKDCFRCTVCNRPLSIHSYFLSGKRNFYCINHCNFESVNSHSSIVQDLRSFRSVTREKLCALGQNLSPYGVTRRPKLRDSDLVTLTKECYCQENSLLFITNCYWIECCDEECPYFNHIVAKHQWLIKDHGRKLSESPFELEHYEEEMYESCFIGKEHHNYYSVDEDIGPIILSIKQDLIRGREYFRVLLRSSCHIIGGLVPVSCICADKYKELEVVDALGREMQLSSSWKRLHDNKITEHLRHLDKVMLKGEFKVGVIYIEEGQEKEEDFFNNTNHSHEFEEFLDFLGEKVELRGFSKYNGGLDTQFGLTGEKTIFTEWEGNQFMFHVSTLLPLEENDEQKLQRKRHIGNDIVCIVFLASSNAKFRPNSIKSNFLHTFIVVQPKIEDTVRYQVGVTSRDLVLPYGPPIPSTPTFAKDNNFKNWLLTKVINGERASYKSPKFAAMQERTRRQLLVEMLNEIEAKDSADIRKEKSTSLQKIFQTKSNGKSSSFDYGKSRLPGQLSGWVSERFDDTDQLRKDMSRVFNSGLLSNFYDVTFIVGLLQTKAIPAVKAVLVGRSRVFQEMFLDAGTDTSPGCSPRSSPMSPSKTTLHKSASSPPVLRSKRKISFDILRKRTSSERQYKRDEEDSGKLVSMKSRGRSEYLVTEFEPEEFLLLIEYLHTGSCIISPEALPGLLGAAEHYEIEELIKLCLNCTEDLMTPKTVCPLLVAVRKYSSKYAFDAQLQEKILEFIAANFEEVLQAFDVAALSEDCLLLILTLDIALKEIEKFQIVKKWFERNYHIGLGRCDLPENSSLLQVIDLTKLRADDLEKVLQSNLYPRQRLEELLKKK